MSFHAAVSNRLDNETPVMSKPVVGNQPCAADGMRTLFGFKALLHNQKMGTLLHTVGFKSLCCSAQRGPFFSAGKNFEMTSVVKRAGWKTKEGSWVIRGLAMQFRDAI